MKYKDRNTIKSWNKQVDKLDQDDSSRTLRRKRERELTSFSKSICLVIDKEWWECVSEDQKYRLYHAWNGIKYNNFYNNNGVKFEDWAKEIRKTTEIDKSLYREKTINKLLS